MNDDDMEWQIAAMRYLARLAEAEYQSQRSSYKGNKKKFRFTPPQYMLDLIEFTKRNDEQGFKTRKMLEGYSTALGV